MRWILPFVVVVIFLGGCGDFFDQKPIEVQTKLILTELREIKENKHISNPLPEIYRAEAQRLTVKDGVKLFYFTKHHTVEKISKIVSEQLGLKVSSSHSINQLIVHCANNEEADIVLEFLSKMDIAPIQVNIDCLILERFADLTMDWETSIEINNLLGEKITLGGKEGPEFPGASLRESRRSEFGLDIGYWNQKTEPHEFRAAVDLLISRGYLKILMNPVLEVVNGEKGKVVLRDYAPLEMIVTKEGVDPYSLTEYRWVEDTLEVTPHVFADGSIALSSVIQLGSKSKPEGVVQTSIITERRIEVTENRIFPGKSLVIGGIRKSEERAVIRGVPFLKDIPILRVLFSSKDFEEKATEVVFILTPSISSGGMDYLQMRDEMQQKRVKPEYKVGLQEVLSDPFGTSRYAEKIEQKAAPAEYDRVKSEIEKAAALEEVDEVKKKLLKATEQVTIEKIKTAKAMAEAKKAKQEAVKIFDEAEKTKREVEKAWADFEKIRQDVEKAEDKQVKDNTEDS